MITIILAGGGDEQSMGGAEGALALALILWLLFTAKKSS